MINNILSLVFILSIATAGSWVLYYFA
jgi:hypothetical protein